MTGSSAESCAMLSHVAEDGYAAIQQPRTSTLASSADFRLLTQDDVTRLFAVQL